MKTPYQKAMENVRLPEDAKQRLLRAMEDAGEDARLPEDAKQRILREVPERMGLARRRAVSLAAALTLLAVTAGILYGVWRTSQDPGPFTCELPGITETPATATLSPATATPAPAYDYSKILQGDLSDFAGVYVNGNGKTLTLNADGTEGKAYTDEYGVASPDSPHEFALKEDGHYVWNVIAGAPHGTGYDGCFYPIGVDVNVDGTVVPTDTTKIRLYMWPRNEDLYTLNSGLDPADTLPDRIYYPEQINTPPPPAYDYSKILRNDLSDFAGVYATVNGSILSLDAAGGIYYGFSDPSQAGYNESVRSPEQQEDGSYYWDMSVGVTYYTGSDISVEFYPIGVEIPRQDGSAFPTDTSQIRLFIAHGYLSDKDMPDAIYYPQP